MDLHANRSAIPGAGSETGEARWIRAGGSVVYSVFHTPEPYRRRDAAVLMVAPFGWEDVESHRARREWAVKLARAGFSTLRFDLPGTGDSAGGPRDPGLFTAWTNSVIDLTAWLRIHSGAQRVAVIGIGLGGLIATNALSQGAEIDDLVLWAVRASGRSMLREVLSYAKIVASRYPEDQPGDEDDSGTLVTGFYLAKETADAITSCDLSQLQFPPTVAGRRALLLSRDSRKIDPDLIGALQNAGVAVETAEVRDYGDLTTHPQSLTLKRPTATMERVTRWLERTAPQLPARTSAQSHAPADALRDEVVERFTNGDDVFTETIMEFETASLKTVGVLTRPLDSSGDERAPFMAVLISAGAIRKIGPHRMWVELARRWAPRGVPTLRVDIQAVGDARGLGDSGRDERYQVSDVGVTSPSTTSGISELLDALGKQGLAERFMLVGYCSGAYVSMQVALTEPRVVALVGLNQEAIIYDENIHQMRMIEQIVGVWKRGVIRRLRDGVSRHQLRQLRAAVHFWVRSWFGRRLVQFDRHEAGRRILDRLTSDEIAVTLVNSQISRLRAEVNTGADFEHTERWPGLVMEELPTQDHMARAMWLQRMMHSELDRALDRALERVSPAETSSGDDDVATLRTQPRSDVR